MFWLKTKLLGLLAGYSGESFLLIDGWACDIAVSYTLLSEPCLERLKNTSKLHTDIEELHVNHYL